MQLLIKIKYVAYVVQNEQKRLIEADINAQLNNSGIQDLKTKVQKLEGLTKACICEVIEDKATIILNLSGGRWIPAEDYKPQWKEKATVQHKKSDKCEKLTLIFNQESEHVKTDTKYKTITIDNRNEIGEYELSLQLVNMFYNSYMEEIANRNPSLMRNGHREPVGYLCLEDRKLYYKNTNIEYGTL